MCLVCSYKYKNKVQVERIMDKEDPRATKIVTSGEQQQISEILTQIQSNQHVNAFFVLSKFIDCNEIKNEPEFCETLFHDHTSTVMELFQWMLTPKLVAARKKIKTKVDPFPYQCREFMKDNWCFYEQMYIAARNKKIQFSDIFNFLRKEYFDKDTIYTALGYFADVMIPFAKYQFSGSFNLTKSLETTANNQQTLSIMKILPETLIEQLINYCHYQPIFQFLKTSILVSIEDPRDYQISKSASLKLMNAVKIQNLFSKFPPQNATENDELAKAIDILENITNSLKQITQNIDTTGIQIQLRTFTLIKTVLQSDIISNSVTQLTKSRLCSFNKEKDRLHSSVTINGNTNNQLSVSTQLNQNSFQNYLPSLGSLPFISENDQQDLVQIFLKILSTCVQIYTKLPKSLSIPQEAQINSPLAVPILSTNLREGSDKVLEGAPKSNTPKMKQKLRQLNFIQYSNMLNDFHDQLQTVLNNMEIITKLVYNEAEGASYSKVIPFSSGENVKAITFMKFQFFKLLHNCLVMLQTKEPEVRASNVGLQSDLKPTSLKRMKSIILTPFDFKVQKVFPLEIIKKYLNENRWNNLAHHVLEKVCHLLIIRNYEYIKRNIEKDKNNKFSDSFLAYLIENFTKRDFIFLNTVKFTSQGNLQSLYIIAKDLAYTLNSTNQLVIFINQFEPWKKFLMTDLKNYEQKAFPPSVKPQFYEKNETQVRNIQVDQVDSIKKLIENISTTKKWPSKLKNKNLSKSGIFQIKNTGDQYMKSETREHMNKTYGKNSTSKKIETEGKDVTSFDLGLEQSIVRKIRVSKKGSSQIQQFRLPDEPIKSQQATVKREQKKEQLRIEEAKITKSKSNIVG